MGTRQKINAIWWNIKINVQKLSDICGYELSTNLQNFMQKDLTKWKYSKKFWGGGYFFSETPWVTFVSGIANLLHFYWQMCFWCFCISSECNSRCWSAIHSWQCHRGAAEGRESTFYLRGNCFLQSLVASAARCNSASCQGAGQCRSVSDNYSVTEETP